VRFLASYSRAATAHCPSACLIATHSLTISLRPATRHYFIPPDRRKEAPRRLPFATTHSPPIVTSSTNVHARTHTTRCWRWHMDSAFPAQKTLFMVLRCCQYLPCLYRFFFCSRLIPLRTFLRCGVSSFFPGCDAHHWRHIAPAFCFVPYIPAIFLSLKCHFVYLFIFPAIDCPHCHCYAPTHRCTILPSLYPTSAPLPATPALIYLSARRRHHLTPGYIGSLHIFVPPHQTRTFTFGLRGRLRLRICTRIGGGHSCNRSTALGLTRLLRAALRARRLKAFLRLARSMHDRLRLLYIPVHLLRGTGLLQSPPPVPAFAGTIYYTHLVWFYNAYGYAVLPALHWTFALRTACA